MTVLTGTRSTATPTRLAVRYIDDMVVLSATHAWTFMRLPLVPYEFLSAEGRKSIAERIFLSLSNLVSTEPVDVHLLVTSRPVSIDFWADDLDERVARSRPAPGWASYRADMADHLRDQKYLRKEVYLAVCLGPRRGGKDSPKASPWDFLGPVRKMLGKAEMSLDLEDDVVPANELDHFREAAAAVRRSMATSHVRATGAHPNAVAWLIKKGLHPAMTCPPPTVSPRRVWGPGEIEALGEGQVTNGHKHLAIEQIDPDTGDLTTGYVATLALSRFPDELLFPDQEPWMHFASSLAFPVDMSSRLTLMPAAKVRKDVARKLADAKDQAKHIAETGSMVPIEIQEQHDRATALEYLVNKDRVPWAYGRHRLTVTAPTREALYARVRKVVEHYRDLSIDVEWPSGDQFDLLCEAMPGDKVRSRAYFQKQELMLVAGGMPTASAEVGDRIDNGKGWLGPYLGETTSRVRTMVCFAAHVAIARNRAPGVAITGAPGGGKSFLAFTLAYQMAMQGVWTIYIDPKADAKPMVSLPGLGRPRLFDLRQGNDGMLDPFSLGETPSECTLLALETLRLLLGGSMSEDREEALLGAVQRVAASPEPSLAKVVEVLGASENVAARNLGSYLHTIRGLPFARLCFAPQQGQALRPQDGLTVVTLLGLDLPRSGMAQEDYSYENRLAVSVMYLLTRYARGLMLSMDKSHPKAICIDEAWAVTSTPQGAKLIPEVARMGRSHNTAMVLVSQNAGDLMDQQVTNSISTIFSFRSQVDAEISSVLHLLGMEDHEAHRSTVRDLENGECLMRDIDGRLARVAIDAWDTSLFQAFDTNPETRDKVGAAQGAHRGSGADINREWAS